MIEDDFPEVKLELHEVSKLTLVRCKGHDGELLEVWEVIAVADVVGELGPAHQTEMKELWDVLFWYLLIEGGLVVVLVGRLDLDHHFERGLMNDDYTSRPATIDFPVAA